MDRAFFNFLAVLVGSFGFLATVTHAESTDADLEIWKHCRIVAGRDPIAAKKCNDERATQSAANTVAWTAQMRESREQRQKEAELRQQRLAEMSDEAQARREQRAAEEPARAARRMERAQQQQAFEAERRRLQGGGGYGTVSPELIAESSARTMRNTVEALGQQRKNAEMQDYIRRKASADPCAFVPLGQGINGSMSNPAAQCRPGYIRAPRSATAGAK